MLGASGKGVSPPAPGAGFDGAKAPFPELSIGKGGRAFEELVLAVPLSGRGGILVPLGAEVSPEGNGGSGVCVVAPTGGTPGALLFLSSKRFALRKCFMSG